MEVIITVPAWADLPTWAKAFVILAMAGMVGAIIRVSWKWTRE